MSERGFQELADALIAVAGDSGWNEEHHLAAAVVELVYHGCFVVPHTHAADLGRQVRGQPLPASVRRLLGDRLAREIEGRGRELLIELVPLMVLHQCAAEHPTTLHTILHQALTLALDPQLSWADRDEPPMLLTSTKGPISRVLPGAGQRAVDEFWVARKAERVDQAPTINGRPHEALTPPQPHLTGSFSWWSLQLGAMLASPRAGEPAYVDTIRQIGARCLQTMPQAHAQARAKRVAEPDEVIDDRYGSEHNESLPRYARWLSKAGDYAGAKEVCEMALRFRIEPASPGAFERALATANKKVQQPSQTRQTNVPGDQPTKASPASAAPARSESAPDGLAPASRVPALFRPSTTR